MTIQIFKYTKRFNLWNLKNIQKKVKLVIVLEHSPHMNFSKINTLTLQK